MILPLVANPGGQLPAGEGFLRAEAVSISAGRRGCRDGATDTGGQRSILGGRKRDIEQVCFFKWICSSV